MQIAKPLKLFLAVNCALILLCLLSELVCERLHLPSQYTWPLTPKQERLIDLMGFWMKFRHFHTREFFTIDPKSPFAYPAPMAVLYKIVYMVRWHTIVTFLVALFLTVSALAFAVARKTAGFPVDRKSVV